MKEMVCGAKGLKMTLTERFTYRAEAISRSVLMRAIDDLISRLATDPLDQ